MAITSAPFGKSLQKASAIRDPLYRYLHHIIGSLIVPWYHSRDKVNMGDIFFLYSLLRPHPCALVAGLAEYFATAYRRQEHDRLFGGSYVTAIVRSLGIVPESDPLLSPAIPSTRLCRALISSIRLTHTFHGISLRFRTCDFQVWVPEVLPE
ncbi:hypothetical protein Hanom_Chr05g00413861 [Helianthus anomalus]